MGPTHNVTQTVDGFRLAVLSAESAQINRAAGRGGQPKTVSGAVAGYGTVATDFSGIVYASGRTVIAAQAADCLNGITVPPNRVSRIAGAHGIAAADTPITPADHHI